MEEEKNYKAIIEAVIFFEKEVVSLERIAKLANISKEDCEKYLYEIQNEFERDIHGINIIEVAGGFTIQIKKDIYPDLKDIYDTRKKHGLSKSVLTVLSIISYKQPITKLEIDEIRGVSSDNSIRILLEKALIEIVGRKEALGRPLLYGTTSLFLKQFNLKDLNDLPKINELKEEEFDG